MVPDSSAFVLFGPAHLSALAAVFLAALLTPTIARRLRSRDRSAIGVVVLVLSIAAYQIGSYAWSVGVLGTVWYMDLPLHLCDASAILCAVMLATRNYRLFEVSYFWSIGGSIPALLTPDMRYTFPHPSFLVFFFGHGIIVVATLYAVFNLGFAPRLRSIGVSMLALIGYCLAIAPLNYVLQTNYMYLRAKPSGTTPLDFLGPWPWYLLALTALSLLVYLLCYAPFALRRKA